MLAEIEFAHWVIHITWKLNFAISPYNSEIDVLTHIKYKGYIEILIDFHYLQMP